MQIVQIVASVEEEAAGPSYSVPRLSQSLAELGHDVHLMSLGPPGENMDGRLRRTRFKRDMAGVPAVVRLGFSSAMRAALDEASGQTDVFHMHGLWMMPNVYPAFSARKANKRLMLAPRGMLGPPRLKISANVKRVFWALRQGAAARAVDCFHATSEQEYEDIRAYGLTQPVAIIPNGIDVLDLDPAISPPYSPCAMSLGRIHPIKGLDKLILAWKQIEDDFPDWRLHIVGPDEGGYAGDLKQLAGQLQTKNVSVTGPVFGREKHALLREAELFVLPTLSENFAMTVAESLAAGTPVISTKGAPWQGLEDNRCGWWIDHGVEPLAVALRTAMSLPVEKRCLMGQHGRAWMIRDFSWKTIARQMAEVYIWLCEGGKPPDCVRVS